MNEIDRPYVRVCVSVNRWNGWRQRSNGGDNIRFFDLDEMVNCVFKTGSN